MSKSMLEYAKKILNKVSFDIKLFRKELAKAYQYLLKEEIEELRNWVTVNYGDHYNLAPVYVEK